jgi:hypothetical protein
VTRSGLAFDFNPCERGVDVRAFAGPLWDAATRVS